MKKTTLLLLATLLLAPAAKAQTDTAAAIVDRYLTMLNYTSLPADSMLTLETSIRIHDSEVRFEMKRHFAADGMVRVEVWRGDTLTLGLCSNGSTRYRKYSMQTGWWDDIEPRDMAEAMEGYDYRGPLYDWRQRGITLAYEGPAEMKGHPMQVVRARQKRHFMRRYFFDATTSLLTMVLEEDNLEDTKDVPLKLIPIDFKFIHEYTPVGFSLVPTQESYQRDGLLHIMETRLRMEPLDRSLFNQD